MSTPAVIAARLARDAYAGPTRPMSVASGNDLVTFSTNETADQLTYVENNGAAVSLPTLTAGTHTFTLASALAAYELSIYRR